MIEEIKEAIKLFGREDLLTEYGIQDTDTNIEVFLSVKDMIKYYKQDKEIERLHSIIKEVRELLNQEWYSVLRKETIRKVREILDKENNNEDN